MSLTLKEYEADLKRKKGGRLYGSKIVSEVLLDEGEDPWDTSRDMTLEEYKREQMLKRGLNVGSKPFVPSLYKLKSRKVSRKAYKSRKVSRKSRKVSRKAHKSRKVSRKVR